MSTSSGLPNFYAVVMGFNKFKDQERLQELRYAEKDAYDLYNVLIDIKIGNYAEENVRLITGNISEDEIETALYTTVVKERTPDDIVLVYYSGHGFFAGNEGDAYLATPGVSVTDILNNPKAGLKMEDLYNDLFLETEARQVIFILDCCHSGAFVPQYLGKGNIFKDELLDNKLFSGEGRVALVSSPRGVSSRENRNFQNGIFTYYLILGLKGAAAEPSTGEVTMSSLVSFVQAKTPQSQPALFYGHSQRIVLTHPTSTNLGLHQPEYFTKTIFQTRPDREVLGVSSLPSSIEKQISFIDIVLEELKRTESLEGYTVNERILEAMRESINAEIVLVENANQDLSVQNKYLVSKTLGRPKINYDRRNEILKQISPVIFEEKDKLLESRYGLFKPLNGFKNKGKNIVLIPLNPDFPREFLIFSGVNSETLEKGELMGQIFISVYKATNEYTAIDILDIENVLLDDIKMHFGYVPITIYNQRFDNFTTRLQRIRFAFEPIVNLGRRNPQIDSWEALARDPETGRAPFGLFKAAKLWGNKFIRILDLYCLGNATQTYVDIWNSERNQSKKDPLSVNVFPNTLYHPDYFLELERIVNQTDLLKGKELVLEISEQLPIPYISTKSGQTDFVSYFEEQLHEYHNKFDISFAVDDFGAGYASIGRMIKLELDHIKIDREILHHRFPLHTIEYVINTVRGIHRHRNTNIVLEGYDGESRASLAEIYDTGIRYVQGHLLRRASETVRDLDEETKKFIVEQLNQEKSKESKTTFDDDDVI